MKHVTVKTFLLATALIASTHFTSCKNKAKETDSSTTTIAPPTIDTTPQNPPVTIAPDDALTTGARDATKDYPGVTASVENGEITLTGDIERSKLPTLMASLNSLKAKKVNNRLNIK